MTEDAARPNHANPVRTLTVAGVGGVAFHLLGVPAAFLTGAIFAVAAASLAGLDQRVPDLIRDGSYILLGVVVGTTVDTDTIDRLAQWPVSIAALILALGILLVVLPRYFTMAHGFDRPTARLCAIPGALSLVVALSESLPVDARRVAVLQSIRLLVLMLLIPVGIGVGAEPAAATGAAKPALSLGECAILVAVSSIGIPVANRLRVPAAAFTGPMLTASLLFALGVFEGRLPDPVAIAAFVVMGAVIGQRFAGVGWRYFCACLVAGLGGVCLAVAITALVAWPTAAAVDLPFIQVWLAIAPGGFDAMTVLALALEVDPAFVAGHQLVRLLCLYAFVPLLFRGEAAVRR